MDKKGGEFSPEVPQVNENKLNQSEHTFWTDPQTRNHTLYHTTSEPPSSSRAVPLWNEEFRRIPSVINPRSHLL